MLLLPACRCRFATQRIRHFHAAADGYAAATTSRLMRRYATCRLIRTLPCFRCLIPAAADEADTPFSSILGD